MACSDELKVIIGLLKLIYGIVQIVIPIILLLYGTFDLGKAVMAGDEKEIKAATGLLLKRAVAAISVFLLLIVVKLVTGMVGDKAWIKCWDEASFDKGKLSSAPYVELINNNFRV